ALAAASGLISSAATPREQIGEEILVDVAGEDTRQYAAEEVFEAAGEFFVRPRLEVMKNESAEEDLASCVVGALLLAQPRLEISASRISIVFRATCLVLFRCFRQQRVISRRNHDAGEDDRNLMRRRERPSEISFDGCADRVSSGRPRPPRSNHQNGISSSTAARWLSCASGPLSSPWFGPL